MLAVKENNENVRLVSAEINDKGTLQISFAQGKKLTLAERMNAATDSSSKEITNFLEFPFGVKDWQGKTETWDANLAKAEKFKNKLTHILLQYVPSDKIKWDLFKGLGITDDNASTKLVDEQVVKGLYNNIADQFVAAVKAIPAKSLEKEYRLKLERSSKKSHFPKIPDYAPFMEPMEIPAEASKLKFSEGEIKRGKNNGERLVAEATPEETSQNLADLDNLFKQDEATIVE